MTEYETLDNAKTDWQQSLEVLYTHEEEDVVISLCKEPEKHLREGETDKYRVTRYFKNHRDNWNVSVDEDRENLATVLETYTQLLTGNATE